MSHSLSFADLDYSLKKRGTRREVWSWWQFIQLMGGATANRKDNPIKLMKIDSKERGKYGDPIGKTICGVETGAIQLPTRLHQ